jgi:hypothetical protein
LIEKFGADGVRVGLLLSASVTLFDEELCNQGKDLPIKYGMLSNWDGKFQRQYRNQNLQR